MVHTSVVVAVGIAVVAAVAAAVAVAVAVVVVVAGVGQVACLLEMPAPFVQLLIHHPLPPALAAASVVHALVLGCLLIAQSASPHQQRLLVSVRVKRRAMVTMQRVLQAAV